MTGVTDSDAPRPRRSHGSGAATERPASDLERDELLDQLSDLVLPLLWTLRRAATRALEPLGLRPGKALVLGMIASGIGSPSALADLLETTPQALSALLGDLEERGLVARRLDPDDRRRVLVEPTDEGLAMTERIRTAWNAATAERITSVTNQDLRHLVRIYRAFAEGS